MAKVSKKDYQESLALLREWIKPGDTVYTILDHVSSSGMSRAIRVVLLESVGDTVESVAPGGKPTDYIRRDSIRCEARHPNYAVGKVLGLRHWKRNGREQDALIMGGCGMDMGFSLVYNLSHTLYPTYTCLGQGKCPSAYHSNHRSTVRCGGADDRICWRPDRWDSRYPIPDGWPTGDPIDIGDGQTIPGQLLYCLHKEDDNAPYQVCPTCKGEGSFPNPEGPERFDLEHSDGYALRHKWL